MFEGFAGHPISPGGADHVGYSKRAMAQDMVEVMRALGFERFALAGCPLARLQRLGVDRGRWSPALEHGEAVVHGQVGHL